MGWVDIDLGCSIILPRQYRARSHNIAPDMEKRAEWPARGRAAVSPFPGDILEPFRVVQGALPFLFIH